MAAADGRGGGVASFLLDLPYYSRTNPCLQRNAISNIQLKFYVTLSAMPIQVFVEPSDMRAFTRQQRREGKSVGFVPTMVRLLVSLTGIQC